ncbi:gluconate 2-dehydrogenase gamma chain [Herbaspirillum sp. Sphag1AN]|uniref:gluconate 2-dehydrogenase subunit 3 family protein n=1 Tax=unclassified Herbaspirillum TaxID=2624150 RepID=UPI00161CE6A1|nr:MULTISPECIES: gluconate 2-dehydrogenase subunit 3 family protein [unclassified Herbaspirillum]MBB3211642.1 gluconate 2-dehydrogenase gamma chain [Herbaspirillum sp. Sphag1AN]MBB3245090.1 gluconate 2-dehydrogenase gamma chain [Herbaspirillum sp. Sphag64]
MRRRYFLLTLAVLAGTAVIAKAKVIWGGMPWNGPPASPPQPVIADGWKFFTTDEAALAEAIAERLIPADELSIGAKEAGCVVFIDAQLAGDYGKGSYLYLDGPLKQGLPQAGPQFKDGPATRWRVGLAALDKAVRGQYQGKRFVELSPDKQDALINQWEAGSLALDGVDAKLFFNLVLWNVREGYFADPIYGGNKDMAGWKLVGFPGAQYDFRDYLNQPGKKLDIQPVSFIRKQS